MSLAMVRIIVCGIIATCLIMYSLNSLSSNPLSILSLGIGSLILIYGFSPSTATSIIKAIVTIATAAFK